MLRIILTGIACGFIVLILRNSNKEIADLALICSGVLLSVLTVEYLTKTVNFIKQITALSKVDTEVYKIIFKVIGVGYLCEFASATLEDFGLNSLSKKIILIGKIVIILLATPIISAFINLLTGLL